MPHLAVRDDDALVALYLPRGTVGRAPAVGGPASLVAGWTLVEHVWHSTSVLRLTPPGAAHSVDLYWEAPTGAFRCWYVNLQAPLRCTALGFDTFDHELDVVVAPDRTWRFKDEAEFAAAVAAGVFSAEEAAAVRTEARQVIARLEAGAAPFGEGWERWRPDPTWGTPRLPPGWDADTLAP